MNFLDEVFISGLANLAMHIASMCPFPTFDTAIWKEADYICVQGRDLHQTWSIPLKRKIRS